MAKNGTSFSRKRPGPGRPKGSQNKLTKSAKEAFAAAFDELGGHDGLVKWAKSSKVAQSQFYTLYAKLIPIDVTSDGNRIRTEVILPRIPELDEPGTDQNGR